MGLPGAGKTWIATRFVRELNSAKIPTAFLNGDNIRGMLNDWDFSEEARIRQAERVTTYSLFEETWGRSSVIDIIAPTAQTRTIINPDILIWVDTIKKGRFDDTNKMFEEPDKYNYRVIEHLSEEKLKKVIIEKVIKDIKNGEREGV